MTFKEYLPLIKEIFVSWKSNCPGEFPDGPLINTEAEMAAFEAVDSIDDKKIDKYELQEYLEKMI